MNDAISTTIRPLVPIEPREAADLIALALNLTKGRVRQADIACEANSAVADRLLEYFRQSGIVLMRPPPRIPHSNNSETNRAAIARAEEEDRKRRDA